jgi:hypothetical protein
MWETTENRLMRFCEVVSFSRHSVEIVTAATCIEASSRTISSGSAIDDKRGSLL